MQAFLGMNLGNLTPSSRCSLKLSKHGIGASGRGGTQRSRLEKGDYLKKDCSAIRM
jgi:hypothetical protein